MAVLNLHINKKVKAATLMETLVASVLLIVVFAMASFALNTVFKSTVVSNTGAVEVRMNELFYFYKNGKVAKNHTENLGDWNLVISTQTTNNKPIIQIEAKHNKTNKKLTKKRIDARVY